ncbi:MAG: chemotaxis protein CheA, partial [Bacteroidota bacterium]|nr:chemotaxis protein CheA [Candidatus Kapabacteria bacterium]MDW8219859.1 chemotaxis protein CheA [Bacteroidota bacterium]
MSIRMMPLEGLFNKMKRLVRDLSQRLDKKVHLEIKGAETEMDKTIIEEIADPLMHILRNAIDHGIETPEHRIQVGKSEIGTITLQACYEGNEILLIVEDDGAGINRTTVLEVAQKKGILKTNPDKISDAEVYALIFEPGFSTAEHVTDISGRGVGMDVVKRNIEKLQGSITVQSHEGRGTRFVLHIPLTLAIMDAMIVRVGSNTYALPMLSIRESFRPEQRAITVTMDGQELVRVRNDIYAVIRLHEVYQCTPSTLQLHEGIIIVVEYRERKACLFVDEIVGQQQIVVRSLSQYVGNVRGITGCMIQSNGEVGLIIDVETLLQIGVPTANAALATS